MSFSHRLSVRCMLKQRFDTVLSPTILLILVNLAVYGYSIIVGGNLAEIDLKVLAHIGALYAPAVVEGGEWWRLLSAMFLHGGLTHLLTNMVSLFIVGRLLERFVSVFAYMTLYLISGVIGGLLSLYVHPLSIGVGASGAIFGIFGALIGVIVVNKTRMGGYFREAMREIAAVLGINLAIGLAVPEIDMTAHIGGLVTGIVGGWLYAKNKRYFVPFAAGSFIVMIYLGTGLEASYVSVVR